MKILMVIGLLTMSLYSFGDVVGNGKCQKDIDAASRNQVCNKGCQKPAEKKAAEAKEATAAEK